MISQWQTSPTHFELVVRPPIPHVEIELAGRSLHGKSAASPDVTLEQIHSANCREANHEGVLQQCDAVWTDTPNLTLAIRTADCLPIALVAPGPRLALAHAGWRGLVGGVLENTLANFKSAEETSVWIGPGIGPCCFEVGPEVAKEFPSRHHRHTDRPRVYVDLAGAARERLQNLGVTAITQNELCTRCSQHLLYSYRGSSGGTGRLETRARIRPV